MALDYEKLINWQEPEIIQRYSIQDTILYGLSLGCGSNPVDENQLCFVYEKNLKVIPSMVTILASPWGWLYRAQVGVNPTLAVHGFQGIHLYKTLPVAAEVGSILKVTGIEDKGANHGAIVWFERNLYETKSGDLLATIEASMFCRGDGGIGPGINDQEYPQIKERPTRPPDFRRHYVTLPQSALIFRRHGDLNPIHADPLVALKAGFDKPILHGLCSYGMATKAILETCCDSNPHRLKSISTFFSAPVFPGDVIDFRIWLNDNMVYFEAAVSLRDAIVLKSGSAELYSTENR
jgi:acyl dehydratase